VLYGMVTSPSERELLWCPDPCIGLWLHSPRWSDLGRSASYGVSSSNEYG